MWTGVVITRKGGMGGIQGTFRHEVGLGGVWGIAVQYMHLIGI